MTETPKPAIAKILVVGDAATGKTSLIKRYVYKTFSEKHQTTIGVDFSLKKVKIDGKTLNVQLWDIAGQDRFTALARIYYNHAVAAIVVFDCTSRRTLESAAKWKADIDQKVFLKNGDHIPTVLYANKFDLLSDEIADDDISDEEIDRFCKKHHFCGWFYTSAKTAHNVKEACNYIIAKVDENNKKMEAQNGLEDEHDPDIVRPTADNQKQEDGPCCS